MGLDGAKKIKKCGKRKEGEAAERRGWVEKEVGVDGIGRMRGKREGETDILEKGQAMRARFVNELVCMAGTTQ